MKKRLFPLLIALSALSVAGSAAFYSVFGLSKLFAGAATQVIIMAASLEFAKLVVASLLYQYWDTINKVLKGYLMIACFVLMVITSGGIYGFLSGAYQSTATKSELLDKSLVILEHKQTRFNETKDDLSLEKTQLNQSISDLRISLSNPHSVSWFDKNSQTVITSSSGSARRALQAELKNTITDRDNINLKLDAILDSITTTDIALLNKEISNEEQRELGPLKYLANTTGWPMDKVVNYFLLLIIFVFDPLAIALVVASNMAFAQIRKPKETLIEEIDPNPTVPIEEQTQEEITLDGGEIEVTVEPTEEQLEENHGELKEIDEDYFSDLEDYIKFNREEESIENLTYPQFVEKHYPTSQTKINTYGDDDWATPDKEESDWGRESVEEKKESNTPSPKPINPTEEDLERLEKFLKLKDNKEENDEEIPLERLTDTTQTLATEELIPDSPSTESVEKNNNSPNEKNQDILDVNGHQILRYRKYRE